MRVKCQALEGDPCEEREGGDDMQICHVISWLTLLAPITLKGVPCQFDIGQICKIVKLFQECSVQQRVGNGTCCTVHVSTHSHAIVVVS
jgi:hypothetical protein